MYIRRNESNTTLLEKVDNSNAEIHMPASLWDSTPSASIAFADVTIPEGYELNYTVYADGTNISVHKNVETSDGNSVNTLSIKGPITNTSDSSIPEYITISIVAYDYNNLNIRHEINVKVYFD